MEVKIHRKLRSNRVKIHLLRPVEGEVLVTETPGKPSKHWWFYNFVSQESSGEMFCTKEPLSLLARWLFGKTLFSKFAHHLPDSEEAQGDSSPDRDFFCLDWSLALELSITILYCPVGRVGWTKWRKPRCYSSQESWSPWGLTGWQCGWVNHGCLVESMCIKTLLLVNLHISPVE